MCAWYAPLRALYLGTFVLTDEPVDEPPKLLASEAAKAGLPPTEFQAVPHGTVVTV